MKTVVVAGGTGGVGEGIVRALLTQGHRVIVPSRSSERLDRLRDLARSLPGTFVPMVGFIGSAAGAAALRDRIVREAGRIDVLIPSLGGWWAGRLLETPLEVWHAVMDEMLNTHFVFAHVFLPVLSAQAGGGRYIGIGGGAAYHPVRSSALVSIAGAAQLMLTRALAQENDDPNVDILELVVDGPIRTRDSQTIAEPHWITADEVAAIVTELVATGVTNHPATSTSGPIVRMRPARG